MRKAAAVITWSATAATAAAIVGIVGVAYALRPTPEQVMPAIAKPMLPLIDPSVGVLPKSNLQTLEEFSR